MRERDHFSAISHLVGAAFSLASVIALIVLAAREGDVRLLIGFCVFGASIVLLYTTSALYHFFHVASRTRRVFKRLDHSFIYVLIAGTFTPVCLSVLEGAWGISLLSVIWACAAVGIIAKNVWQVPGWISTSFYLAMGWIAAIPIVQLTRALPLAAIVWLFLGGILYSLGAAFYALDAKYPSHTWFNLHDLFHLFVIAASACHVVFMFYLL